MGRKNDDKDLDFSAIYGKIADENSTTPIKVLKEMQIALDAAWDNPDATVRRRQRELFLNGKPTVEAFILKIVELAKGKR